MALLVICPKCKGQMIEGEDCYNYDCPGNQLGDDDDFGGGMEILSVIGTERGGETMECPECDATIGADEVICPFCEEEIVLL